MLVVRNRFCLQNWFVGSMHFPHWLFRCCYTISVVFTFLLSYLKYCGGGGKDVESTNSTHFRIFTVPFRTCLCGFFSLLADFGSTSDFFVLFSHQVSSESSTNNAVWPSLIMPTRGPPSRPIHLSTSYRHPSFYSPTHTHASTCARCIMVFPTTRIHTK